MKTNLRPRSTDPESFDKGSPTLTTGFSVDCGRKGDPDNTIKLAIITPFKWRFLRSVDGLEH